MEYKPKKEICNEAYVPILTQQTSTKAVTTKTFIFVSYSIVKAPLFSLNRWNFLEISMQSF